jgi:hypothetical protein
LPGPSTLYLSNVRLRVVVANPIVDRRLSTGPAEIISTDADVLGIAVNPQRTRSMPSATTGPTPGS